MDTFDPIYVISGVTSLALRHRLHSRSDQKGVSPEPGNCSTSEAPKTPRLLVSLGTYREGDARQDGLCSALRSVEQARLACVVRWHDNLRTFLARASSDQAEERVAHFLSAHCEIGSDATLLQFDPTLQALIGGSVLALSAGMRHAVAISSYGDMLASGGLGPSGRDHLFALANASAIVVSSDANYRQLTGELAEFRRSEIVKQVDVKIPMLSDAMNNGGAIRKVVYLSDEHLASRLAKVVATLAVNQLAHEVLVLAGGGGAAARRRLSSAEQVAVVEWSSSTWRKLLDEGNVVVVAQVGDTTKSLILEALSNGLPCILHNDADGRRFANDGGCVTADCFNNLNLFDAIDLVVRDSELRADLVARAISRSGPDWRDWYARIFGMFCPSITHTH